ncbi:MAG: TraR/DksA C4-type zinc finger protein [Planctomycetota bacterium]
MKKVAKKKVVRKASKKQATKKQVARKVVKKKVAQKPVAQTPVAQKPVAKKKVAQKKVAKKAAVGRKVDRAVSRRKPVRKRAPPSPRKPRAAKAMKKSEAARFQQLLLRKRESLLGDLESLESQAFKTSGQDASANHMADFGSDNYEQEFTFGLIENNEVVMRQITGALKEIEVGRYGLCQGCGLMIPTPRLEVLPWAAYCVTCQEQNERL